MLLYPFEGAINLEFSDFTMNGTTTFTDNLATDDGGEEELQKIVAFLPLYFL